MVGLDNNYYIYDNSSSYIILLFVGINKGVRIKRDWVLLKLGINVINLVLCNFVIERDNK